MHGKTLWNSFLSILTLTKQMHQKTDPAFQELLKRARQGSLNIRNIEILNQRVATSLLDSGSLDTIVVV